ncbi:unnamed protein product [Caretta caretta]
MAPWAKPSGSCISSLSPWLGVHQASYFQLISPQKGPGLPKHLHVMRVNDLVLSTYDNNTGRLAPRNGYTLGNQDSQQFWRACSALCLVSDSWVETKYQALVWEVNSSSPRQ